MVGDWVLEKGSHLLPYLVLHGVLLEGGGGPYHPLAFLSLPLKQASTSPLPTHHPYTLLPSGQGRALLGPL